jgi:hypothetical protein
MDRLLRENRVLERAPEVMIDHGALAQFLHCSCRFAGANCFSPPRKKSMMCLCGQPYVEVLVSQQRSREPEMVEFDGSGTSSS